MTLYIHTNFQCQSVKYFELLSIKRGKKRERKTVNTSVNCIHVNKNMCDAVLFLSNSIIYISHMSNMSHIYTTFEWTAAEKEHHEYSFHCVAYSTCFVSSL